jgi:hypothetical protein
MDKTMRSARPKFLVDDRGNRKGVLLSLKEFREIEELIEIFEDTIALLKAEREATSFTPYDEFRKTWLSS